MPSQSMSARLQRLTLFIRGTLFAPEERERLIRREVRTILSHLPKEDELEQQAILVQLRAYGLGRLLDH